MSKVKKDIKSRKYILNEEKNLMEYACCNVWIREKLLSFHKYQAAAVEIFNNEITEYFTFTPQFGRFERFSDIFDYVEFWLKENEVPFTNVEIIIDELSALIYKIDLETMELGKEEERISGRECLTYGYRKVEKTFFDKDKDDYVITNEWGWYQLFDIEEEDEYDDIDPQF